MDIPYQISHFSMDQSCISQFFLNKDLNFVSYFYHIVQILHIMQLTIKFSKIKSFLKELFIFDNIQMVFHVQHFPYIYYIEGCGIYASLCRITITSMTGLKQYQRLYWSTDVVYQCRTRRQVILKYLTYRTQAAGVHEENTTENTRI